MSATRESLRALTARGRGFLAGGATAVLCGIVLGEEDLVGIGALLALLPLATVCWMARSRHDLEVDRTLSSVQVEAGQPVTVRLELRNAGPRTQLLLVEEHLPYALGPRPRFVLDPLSSGQRIQLEYAVRSDLRGAYRLGPLRLRVEDPFGMVELDRRFSASAQLLVTPRVEPLPSIHLDGARSGAGDDRPRSFVGGNAADVTVREYRTGDELRRVHWRSTARRGDLMVRREERPWQARCTLLLDNRHRAHRGRGVASSLEAAVQAAASVAVHLTGRGYQVRLVTASGEEVGRGWHDGHLEASTRALLAQLALLEGTGTASLVSEWLDESVRSSLFVAVLGAVDDNDQPFFSRLGHLGTSRALALDVGAWGPAADGSTTPPATGWLRSIGWKATTLCPGTPVAAAWTGLRR